MTSSSSVPHDPLDKKPWKVGDLVTFGGTCSVFIVNEIIHSSTSSREDWIRITRIHSEKGHLLGEQLTFGTYEVEPYYGDVLLISKP